MRLRTSAVALVGIAGIGVSFTQCSSVKEEFAEWKADRKVEAAREDGSHLARSHASDGSTVTVVASPGEPTTTIEESADGASQTVRIEGEPSVSTRRDARGLVTHLLEEDRLILSQEWRPDGQLAAVETPSARAHFEYDAAGHPQSFIVSPRSTGRVLDQWTRISLDAEGRPAEVTDCRGLKAAVARPEELPAESTTLVPSPEESDELCANGLRIRLRTENEGRRIIAVCGEERRVVVELDDQGRTRLFAVEEMDGGGGAGPESP